MLIKVSVQGVNGACGGKFLFLYIGHFSNGNITFSLNYMHVEYTLQICLCALSQTQWGDCKFMWDVKQVVRLCVLISGNKEEGFGM